MALHLPDYRAAERTFGLILQASGRAGRGDKEGKVVVQSYYPDHPAIVAAVKGDYIGFANSELAARRALGFPPFVSAIRFVVRGPDEQDVAEFAQTLGDALREAVREVNDKHGYDPGALAASAPEPEEPGAARDSSPQRRFVPTGEGVRPPLVARILVPAPAPFAKLRGNFRFHLQILGAPGALLRDAAELVCNAKLKAPRHVQWIVDVDPLESL